MLAELNGADILCVGVELVKATRGREDAWRRIAGRLRGIYSGPLVYAANWGSEFERLGFWDAFDFLGVDVYYPLTPEPEPDADALAAGARRVVERLRGVQQQYGKPLLVTEAGFASIPGAWREPWKDARDGPVDLEAQARSLEALLAALDGQPWVAGAWLWKWPSGPGYGGARDRSHVLAGKPAEEVMARWMRRGAGESDGG
jgi:hypothetical protein